MATVRVTEIIRRVELVLQDTNIRWPRTELQSWLNEAYLTVVAMRPDSNTLTGTLTCVGGTRQTIATDFPNSLRLIDVVRNLSGTMRSVRHIIRSMLDEQRPEWHNETQSTSIEHYMFDPRIPKEFLVYPPAQAGTTLEIAYSITVTPHSLSEAALDPEGNETEVIRLDDIYASTLVDWILYRAYSKDSDYAANAERAGSALAAFQGGLGNKNQVDAGSDPQPVVGGRT